MEGFHAAVLATVAALAKRMPQDPQPRINLFAGMLSPADFRHLKALVTAFGLSVMLLPDYSQTLDGALWESYRRIPPGGTPLQAIAAAGGARASIELGSVLAGAPHTAATLISQRCELPAVRLGLPIGLRATDALLQTLAEISGRPVPEACRETRGRLLDALVDGHKHVNGIKAAVYGEEDLVAGIAGFLAEVGVVAVVCASGGGSGRLGAAVRSALPAKQHDQVRILERADFVSIEQAVKDARPDLIIGSSKGYALSRRLHIPLLRVGFPIHDRVGGSRILHVGYEGALCLFERIANLLIERRQDASAVGYTYM
jgi:nitrogenase molybdenum-iron protein NifN